MIVKFRFFLSAFILATLLACTSKPDKVIRVNGPVNGIIYLIEIGYGDGPVSADYTKVYVAAESSSSSEKKLVLSGLNLDVKINITGDPLNVDICIPSGAIVDSFSNEQLIAVQGRSIKIRNHLKEDCF